MDKKMEDLLFKAITEEVEIYNDSVSQLSIVNKEIDDIFLKYNELKVKILEGRGMIVKAVKKLDLEASVIGELVMNDGITVLKKI